MGPRLHPLYGIGGVQICDFSCSCVYCDFEFFKSSCSQRFKVAVAGNYLISVYLGAQRLNAMDRHPMFLLPIGIFSKCLLGVKYA